MKQKFLFLAFIVFSLSAFSASNSENEKRIVELQQKVRSLNSELGTLRSIVSSLNKKVVDMQVIQDTFKTQLHSTNDEVSMVKNDLSQKATELGDSIGTTYGKVNQTSQDLNSRSLLGVIGLLCALIIAGLVYLLLKKKINSGQTAIDSIREAQKKLNEESVKLDNQLIEIMNKQLDIQKESAKTAPSSSNGANTVDHSLALKVADEIVRIELNLSRMDPSVKGHKQLSKAAERIKNNFLAQGYEIVDMLGRPYNEGMKVVASFVSDENLKEGEQIITGITKPQVNYNGEMIQAAQITVSQNI